MSRVEQDEWSIIISKIDKALESGRFIVYENEEDVCFLNGVLRRDESFMDVFYCWCTLRFCKMDPEIELVNRVIECSVKGYKYKNPESLVKVAIFDDIPSAISHLQNRAELLNNSGYEL